VMPTPTTSCRSDVGFTQGLTHDFTSIRPDFLRIVLYPPCLGEDLAVFELACGDGASIVVEDNGTGARCALVNGENIGRRHCLPFPLCSLKGRLSRASGHCTFVRNTAWRNVYRLATSASTRARPDPTEGV